MKSSTLYAAAGFAVGLLVGAASMRFVRPWIFHHMMSPEQRHEMMFKRFCREVKLTDDQKPQIKAILDTSHAKIEELMKETGPKFDAVRSETNAEIRKLLTPDQQERFDKLHERMQRRFRHHPFGPGRDAP